MPKLKTTAKKIGRPKGTQKIDKADDVKSKKAKKPADKKTPPVAEIEKTETAGNLKPERFLKAVGRRKTAVARVKLFTRGEKTILINEKPFENYFQTAELRQVALEALNKMKCLDKFRVVFKVSGGGLHAQAEAVRHATARALVLFNPDFRKRLRRVGYLTRDPRMRERKKFGLKRARRAPQWAKR